MSTYNDAKDDWQEKAYEAGAKIRGLIDNAGDDAGDFVDNIARDIREKPFQSAAIAVAAGFVLGLIFRR